MNSMQLSGSFDEHLSVPPASLVSVRSLSLQNNNMTCDVNRAYYGIDPMASVSQLLINGNPICPSFHADNRPLREIDASDTRVSICYSGPLFTSSQLLRARFHGAVVSQYCDKTIEASLWMRRVRWRRAAWPTYSAADPTVWLSPALR
jgi:hypothetical protein